MAGHAADIVHWCRNESGVLLEDTLARAGVTDASGLFLKQVSIGTPEKGRYDSTIRLDDALERKALLCHSLNGEPLPGKTTVPLRPGDVVRIETPGGGGYGTPDRSSPDRVSDYELEA